MPASLRSLARGTFTEEKVANSPRQPYKIVRAGRMIDILFRSREFGNLFPFAMCKICVSKFFHGSVRGGVDMCDVDWNGDDFFDAVSEKDDPPPGHERVTLCHETDNDEQRRARMLSPRRHRPSPQTVRRRRCAGRPSPRGLRQAVDCVGERRLSAGSTLAAASTGSSRQRRRRGGSQRMILEESWIQTQASGTAEGLAASFALLAAGASLNR